MSPKLSRMLSSVSRVCTMRMSAMFSTTPSQSRPSFRFSRASSITSSTCSTPCSEKYSPSALTSAWVAATSAFTVSRPSAGGQSIRISSCWRRDSRSARFRVSSRPIFPLSTSSASASPRFAGIMPLWIASTARAWPASTSPIVGAASGSTSK